MKDTRASASVHSESHMSPSHRACRRAALGPLINPHTTHRGGGESFATWRVQRLWQRTAIHFLFEGKKGVFFLSEATGNFS